MGTFCPAPVGKATKTALAYISIKEYMETQEDPIVSTNRSYGVKRNSSDGQIPSGSKRKRKSETEISMSSSISQVEDQTSLWSENTLNSLQITSKATDLLTISEIISDHILPSLPPLSLAPCQKCEVGPVVTYPSTVNISVTVDNCFKLLDISKSPLINIDVEDVCELNTFCVFGLMFEPGVNKLNHKISSWNQVPADAKLDAIGNWFYQMFYLHGQRFSQQLINICLVQKNETLSESVFIKLFEEFAGMCGLLTLERQNSVTMKINSTKVTSISDIVIPYFSGSDVDNLNILAVCQVKSHFKQLDSPEQTASQPKMKMKRGKTMKYLDDQLLGQHGGELLLNLPLTKRNSLAGIIIQRTNVTFSYFSGSQEKLEKIQAGEPSEPGKILYSRPYNFLKAADRKELMKALITLAVLQLNPHV